MMKNKTKTILIALLAFAFLTSSLAQSQSGVEPQGSKKKVFAESGSGANGRLTKWVGSGFIADSVITESAAGRVGIGTATPGSPLTVNGMIETTLGGIRFPDGTVQTTAVSPFGPSVPINLSGSVPGGIIEVFNQNGIGLFGRSIDNHGVVGFSVNGFGTRGFSSNSYGVHGLSSNNHGVFGRSLGIGRAGVYGENPNSVGVLGFSLNGSGIFGISENSSGVVGQSNSTDPTEAGIRGLGQSGVLAGRFEGNVAITGTLSKAGGSFKIDHPLDPENKYLYHSFVESPEMMNIYNGNITTDQNGMAVVELPEWFESLNRDFRYQLTVVGQFAQAIVAEKVNGNRFTIQTNAPNVEVSWQVTGIRQDAWANRNRIRVEEEKSEKERGYYLHPEAFDQPEERGVAWAHRPDEMRQIKQRREQARRERR